MVTLGVFVCMNTLERFLLCLFSPNLYFSTKFDDYLDVHEELEHTTNFHTCFLHGHLQYDTRYPVQYRVTYF